MSGAEPVLAERWTGAERAGISGIVAVAAAGHGVETSRHVGGIVPQVVAISFLLLIAVLNLSVPGLLAHVTAAGALPAATGRLSDHSEMLGYILMGLATWCGAAVIWRMDGMHERCAE